jgi:hypothetical protein
MTAKNSDIESKRASHEDGAAEGGNTATSEHVRHPGRDRLPFEIEHDLWRAAALNDVAKWIGRAKHILECIERAADQDGALKLGLSSHGVGILDAGWHDYHADGLDALHMTIDDHLRAVRQISGIDRRSAGAGAAHETSTSSSAVGR